MAGAGRRSAFSPRRDRYFWDALEGRDLAMGRWPRRSRTARHEGGGERGEEIGVGTGGGVGEANAACRFDDAGGDLEELEAQCRELGLGQVARFGNGVADGE